MTRQGSSLIAMRAGRVVDAGLRLVGAHTDSPNLSVNQPGERSRWLRAVGGRRLWWRASKPWFDRDLAIAGRVTLLSASGGCVLRSLIRPVRSQSCQSGDSSRPGRQQTAQHQSPERCGAVGHAGGSPAFRFQGVADRGLPRRMPSGRMRG